MGSGGCEEEIVSLLIPGNGNKKTPSGSRHGTRAKLKQVKCVTYYGVQESRITSFWEDGSQTLRCGPAASATLFTIRTPMDQRQDRIPAAVF